MTSIPLVSLTRATLRRAEFGFFGVSSLGAQMAGDVAGKLGGLFFVTFAGLNRWGKRCAVLIDDLGHWRWGEACYPCEAENPTND